MKQCGSPPKDKSTKAKLVTNSYIQHQSSYICKLFPTSPRKYVTLLKHIWDQSYKCPVKHKLMNEIWHNNKETCSLMLQLGKHKGKKSDTKIKACVESIRKKYSSLRQFAQFSSISWTQFQRYCNVGKNKGKKKISFSRKFSAEQILDLQNHITSEGTSFPLPDKKYAGKRFMRFTMKRCQTMYNLMQSTSRKVSLSSFYRHKPKYVKLKGKIPLCQSCCEKCLNFENIIKEGSKYLKGIPKEMNDCIDSTLCSYKGYFPKFCCIQRECDSCSLTTLKERLIAENAVKISDTHKRFLNKEWKKLV